MKINIPKHLINMRRDIVGTHLNIVLGATRLSPLGMGLSHTARYKMFSLGQRPARRARADQEGWIHDMPSVAAGWSKIRDMPAPAEKSFRRRWAEK